eukprot:365042-Chlamydomonas_euryale.AAC.38
MWAGTPRRSGRLTWCRWSCRRWARMTHRWASGSSPPVRSPGAGNPAVWPTLAPCTQTTAPRSRSPAVCCIGGARPQRDLCRDVHCRRAVNVGAGRGEDIGVADPCAERCVAKREAGDSAVEHLTVQARVGALGLELRQAHKHRRRSRQVGRRQAGAGVWAVLGSGTQARAVLGSGTQARTVLGSGTQARAVLGSGTQARAVLGSGTQARAVLGSGTQARTVLGSGTQARTALKAGHTHAGKPKPGAATRCRNKGPQRGAATSGHDKWPRQVAATKGRNKEPQQVAATSGRNKWPQQVAATGGRNKWPQQVAATRGRDKWPRQVAASSGRDKSPRQGAAEKDTDAHLMQLYDDELLRLRSDRRQVAAEALACSLRCGPYLCCVGRACVGKQHVLKLPRRGVGDRRGAGVCEACGAG